MLRALIVEDERDVRDLMTLHLKREGVVVVSVEDGEEALRLLAVEKFAFVVLDWMLPGVSGLEICKRLRSSSSPERVSILMVTARADSAISELAGDSLAKSRAFVSLRHAATISAADSGASSTFGHERLSSITSTSSLLSSRSQIPA